MSLKALLNGETVYAADVAGTTEYNCYECGDAMYFRPARRNKNNVSVVAHFAHKPLPAGQVRTCKAGVSESPEHDNAKETLRLFAAEHFWWLEQATAETEVTLKDDALEIHREADVLYTLPNGKRVIFEAQFTKIPRREIAERTRDYIRLGCYVIWCFPEKRTDLYDFCWKHFYAVVRLSDDGSEMHRLGNISPDRYAPGLKRPFDPEHLPQPSRALAPITPTARPTPAAAPRRMEALERTAYHTLIRPKSDDPWDDVPHHLQSIVWSYIDSNMPQDYERAMYFCEKYELDYKKMRARINAEITAYEQARVARLLAADAEKNKRIA